MKFVRFLFFVFLVTCCHFIFYGAALSEDGPLSFLDSAMFGRYEVASIELADLDGDGDLDLILASEENNSIIQVYENLGGGIFRNSGNTFPFQSPDQRHWNFGIVVADFNGDGRPDIATADAWAGMNVYCNRGGLRFEQVQNFVFPGMGEVKGIAAADLNGDGFIDIILGDHNGESRGDRILLNDGTGRLIDSSQSIGWDITWDVFAIDINRDGAPDYISVNRYAYEPARVHWNDGKGFFTKTFDIPDSMDDSYDIKCFAKGDYSYCFIANSENNSGRPNRFLVFDKTGELIVNKGFGDAGNETKSMCLVDLNSDGDLELVVGNYNGNSLAYSFKPDAGGVLDFAGSIPLFAMSTTSGIACGDINGDGLIDLIVGPQNSHNAAYHLLIQQEPRLTAATDPPSVLTNNSVTLNGTVNPHGLSTTARFEWGTSLSYGNSTPLQLIGNGTDNVSLHATLTGLDPSTTYHHRVTASSSVGTINGVDISFTTAAGSAPLYFPHVATSFPWQTEIAIINTSDQTVTGTLRGLSNGGQLIDTKTVTLSAHGRRQINVADEFTNHTNIGYIIFDTDSVAVQGYTKFYQEGTYRAAIPAVKEVNTSDIYISHIASNPQWWTGVSLVNTTSAKKDLTITFNNGRTVPYTLLANEHKAFTIESLFNNQPQPDIQSAVITNASGVIGLELFGSTGGGNQLEGVLLTDDTASTVYYPHVASNNIWWTGIVAYNPSESACTITVTSYNAAGTPLSTTNLSLAGKGKYIGLVSGLGLPAETAWFKIDSTSPLTGFELFGTIDGKQLAAYAGSGAKTGVFAKIEKYGWTGIAFVNTEAVAASVVLTAYNDNGSAVARQILTVGGYAKVVDFAETIFSQDISGATYIAYSSDRNVVGFQLNGASDSTMLDGLPGLGSTN